MLLRLNNRGLSQCIKNIDRLQIRSNDNSLFLIPKFTILYIVYPPIPKEYF